jgi:hypothetical protein
MNGVLKMKNFIKKLFGIDKIEAKTKESEFIRQAAEKAAIDALEAARIAKLSPKEIATEKKEPWVAVLDTHVNKDNIKNGFFELDWNEYFVLQLRTAGYVGETDEAIVDQWFSELCRNVGAEEGVNMDRRGAGFINVNNLGNGRTEVS